MNVYRLLESANEYYLFWPFEWYASTKKLIVHKKDAEIDLIQALSRMIMPNVNGNYLPFFRRLFKWIMTVPLELNYSAKLGNVNNVLRRAFEILSQSTRESDRLFWTQIYDWIKKRYQKANGVVLICTNELCQALEADEEKSKFQTTILYMECGCQDKTRH